MERTLKLAFYLKRNEKREGQCPIMGMIRLSGTKGQFRTGLKVRPEIWDTHGKRALGKSDEATRVNAEIDELRILAHLRYNDLSRKYGYENVTAEDGRSAIKGLPRAHETLLSVFAAHNEEYLRRIDINRVKGTWRSHVNAYNHLAAFLKLKSYREDISFHELDLTFIERFRSYCKNDLKHKPGTIIQTIIPLRRMVQIAVGKGIIDRDPFDGYRPERPKPQQRYLSKRDFDKLIVTNYGDDRLNFVRDMFAFSAFTGLAYTDLFALTRKNLMEDHEGRLWIRTLRRKSRTPVDVPLLSIATQILYKYKDLSLGENLFPGISYDRLSHLLKKIATACGIDPSLSFHQARHTFATQFCLSRGVPIDTVSHMMGHRSVDATEIYAEVTMEKIHRDMGEAIGAINNSFNFKDLRHDVIQ